MTYKRAFTEEQRDYCIKLLDGHSVAQRGRFDGTYLQQLFGMLAQTIVADLLGAERPKRCPAGAMGDGGVDVVINGMTVDVKVALRGMYVKQDWMVNLPEPQAKYPTDLFLFMSYNKEAGVFEILGSITKKEFLSKAKIHPVGSKIVRDDGSILEVKGCALFDLPIKKLRPIRCLEDLEATGLYEQVKKL